MAFETERLILREYTDDDFAALHEIFSDAQTMKHYPHPFSEDETKSWIKRNIARYAEYGFGLWAVELKGTGQLIGDCGLTMQKINGQMLPEIGYHINKSFQRHGYASEAARTCMKYAFETLKLPAVYSYMKYTNSASYGVALKNGMHFVEEYADPVNTFTRVYMITYDEWKEQQV